MTGDDFGERAVAHGTARPRGAAVRPPTLLVRLPSSSTAARARGEPWCRAGADGTMLAGGGDYLGCRCCCLRCRLRFVLRSTAARRVRKRIPALPRPTMVPVLPPMT